MSQQWLRELNYAFTLVVKESTRGKALLSQEHNLLVLELMMCSWKDIILHDTEEYK